MNSNKYLKYKKKYLDLKNIQFGGNNNDNIFINYTINYNYIDEKDVILFEIETRKLDFEKQNNNIYNKIMKNEEIIYENNYDFIYNNSLKNGQELKHDINTILIDNKKINILEDNNDLNLIYKKLSDFLIDKLNNKTQKKNKHILLKRDKNLIYYKITDKIQGDNLIYVSTKENTYNFYEYKGTTSDDFKKVNIEDLKSSTLEDLKSSTLENMFGFFNIIIETDDEKVVKSILKEMVDQEKI